MKKYIVLLLFMSMSLVGYTQENTDFYEDLSDAAIELTKTKVQYDPSYFEIKYPNGDIPSNKGVNTDVIIRAYRKLNVDLQERVHMDMQKNFDEYPSKELWGLDKTDTNIDHRRVPNLQVFFSRNGEDLPVTKENNLYSAGDIVTWELNNGVKHIGIVTDKKSDFGTPLVVHNSASGQVLQNVLFHFKITGHYRYDGKDSEEIHLDNNRIESVANLPEE